MELQWPLILFTTFVAWSAGLFATQCVMACKQAAPKTQTLSWVAAAVLLVVGGIAVFLHLEHWERIFNGFGHITSGITQELIAIVVLAVVAIVYLVFLRKSDDGGSVPRWLAIVGIVVSAVLVIVMAHSYMMPARPAWDSPFWVLCVLGNACVLGPATFLILMSVKDEPIGCATAPEKTVTAVTASGSDAAGATSATAADAAADATATAEAATAPSTGSEAAAAAIAVSEKDAKQGSVFATVLMYWGSIANAVASILYIVSMAFATSSLADVGHYFDPTHPNEPMLEVADFSPFSGENLLIVLLGVVLIGAAAPIICSIMGKKKGDWTKWAAVALVCAVIGAICVRVAFYNMGASIFMLY